MPATTFYAVNTVPSASPGLRHLGAPKQEAIPILATASSGTTDQQCPQAPRDSPMRAPRLRTGPKSGPRGTRWRPRLCPTQTRNRRPAPAQTRLEPRPRHWLPGAARAASNLADPGLGERAEDPGPGPAPPRDRGLTFVLQVHQDQQEGEHRAQPAGHGARGHHVRERDARRKVRGPAVRAGAQYSFARLR